MQGFLWWGWGWLFWFPNVCSDVDCCLADDNSRPFRIEVNLHGWATMSLLHISHSRLISLVADKWGQHQWGRCESNKFWQIGEKGTPWHYFWEDKSRLTGVPKNSLCQKQLTFAVTSLVLTPCVPFRSARICRRLLRGPCALVNMIVSVLLSIIAKEKHLNCLNITRKRTTKN